MSERQPSKVPTKSDSMRRGARVLLKFVKPLRRSLIVISILGTVSACANGVVPYVVGRFFDALVQLKSADTAQFTPILILLGAWLAIQCTANTVDWLNDRNRRRIDAQVLLHIRDEAFSHILRLPLAFHRTERIAETLEKFSRASWMCAVVVQTSVSIAPQLLSILVGLTVAFIINPYLALILMAGVAVYLAVMRGIIRAAAGALDEGMKSWNEGWGRVSAAVHQAEAVKQATAEDYEEKRNRDGSAETLRVAYKSERMWTNVTAFQRFIVTATQLGIFALSVLLVARGAISPGELVALNGYALMFFGPFVQLGTTWQHFQTGLVAAAETERVLAVPQERYHPDGAPPLTAVRGVVEFRGVSFQYADADAPVLSDISFKSEPGMSVALVGESGVGKSTFISLIGAYHFPTGGAVLIDGIDTHNLDLTGLRRRIAVVPQEVALFNDTIEANIRYGAFDATREAVVRAAEQAHIAGVIDKIAERGRHDELLALNGIYRRLHDFHIGLK